MTLRPLSSLVWKISLLFIATLTALSIYSFNAVYGTISRAFIATETEKAFQIADTVSPTIGLYLYLGQTDKARQSLNSLLSNPNIKEAILVAPDTHAIIASIRRPGTTAATNDIRIARPVIDELTRKKVADLTLCYSSIHLMGLSHQLVDVLKHVGMIVTIVTLILLAALLFLLAPLHTIATAIKEYVPGQKLILPRSARSSEADIIVSALTDMVETIERYETTLHSVNSELENKIAQKTAELTRHFVTDALTKLPNRSALLDHIDRKEVQTLLLMDIDDFKVINDLYGTAAGDKLLVHLSAVLGDIAESFSLHLFKLPGDEFALSSTQALPPLQVHTILHEISTSLGHTPWLIHGQQIYCTAAFGISHSSDHILRTADIALKKAKEEKRRAVILSEHDFNTYRLQLHNNLIVLDHIETAIKTDRIIPHYQPIYSFHTGKIEKFETLMRLSDPEGELLYPGSFLAIAHKAKRYRELMLRLLQKSVTAIADTPFEFSYNITVSDINDPELTDFIFDIVAQYNLSGRFIFELLESEGIDDIDSVRHFIRKAKSMGCKIAIDDFGSGYSNFSRILALEIDYLKIDGSLIQALENNDGNARFMLQTIVDFCRKADIKTIAEFVSSKTIFDRVRALGVDYAQGYLIGKPCDTFVYECTLDDDIIIL